MMLSEQQRTALVQAQTEQAISYIEDYLKDEFEIIEPDFSDLTRIDLGYRPARMILLTAHRASSVIQAFRPAKALLEWHGSLPILSKRLLLSAGLRLFAAQSFYCC